MNTKKENPIAKDSQLNYNTSGGIYGTKKNV